MVVLCEGYRPSGGNGSLLCFQKKNSIGAISSGYHISDRNDGHDDGDGSTRSWPSRTCWGAAYALGEKYGFLLERKFGIAAYDYWYGYSAAQIDLMVIDGPVIDYGADKKKGMGNTQADVEEMDALAEAYAKKKEEEGTMVGETFSLDGFLKGQL